MLTVTVYKNVSHCVILHCFFSKIHKKYIKVLVHLDVLINPN